MITQHKQVKIACWTIYKILLSIHLKPPINVILCLPFRWICMVFKYFFLDEGKGPHEELGYCNQDYFYLEVLAVIVLIHTCHALSGLIFDTEQDEDKSNLLFLLGDEIYDWNLNYSALYFSGVILVYAIEFLKSWWDNLCFLGVPCVLCMYM